VLVVKFEEASMNQIFEEFDPYFCYAVMNCLPKFRANLEKAKFIDYLQEKYHNDKEFEKRCKERLIKPFVSSREIDKNVLKRIRDLNLLYKWSYEPSLKLEGKVTGRALELLVEAILKAELGSNTKVSYEFVDWSSFDYVIVDKSKNDWIAGIQSKVAFVDTKKTIYEMKEFAKRFADAKRFIMFCGGVKGGKRKTEIKQTLENEGWELYYLWTDIDEYEIDDSFYKFIDAIKSFNQKFGFGN
jgi:hypothetical protein